MSLKSFLWIPLLWPSYLRTCDILDNLLSLIHGQFAKTMKILLFVASVIDLVVCHAKHTSSNFSLFKSAGTAFCLWRASFRRSPSGRISRTKMLFRRLFSLLTMTDGSDQSCVVVRGSPANCHILIDILHAALLGPTTSWPTLKMSLDMSCQ